MGGEEGKLGFSSFAANPVPHINLAVSPSSYYSIGIFDCPFRITNLSRKYKYVNGLWAHKQVN